MATTKSPLLGGDDAGAPAAGAPAPAASTCELCSEAVARELRWAVAEAHAMLLGGEPASPLAVYNPLYWALVVLIVILVLPGKWSHALVDQGGPVRPDESAAERNARIQWVYAADGCFILVIVAALCDPATFLEPSNLLSVAISIFYIGGNFLFLRALRLRDAGLVRVGVVANVAFAVGLVLLLALWVAQRDWNWRRWSAERWTLLTLRALLVGTTLLVFSDFGPLWREHVPESGARLDPAAVVASSAAVTLVLVMLVVAAVDKEAEDVILETLVA